MTGATSSPEHPTSASRAKPTHVPVLLQRCLDLLAPAIERPDRHNREHAPVMVDATVGMGGHAAAALARFPELRLIGIDRDPSAVTSSRARLAQFEGRATIVHATYDTIADVVREHAGGLVHAILMDLGVSSPQLDNTERGFSYAVDAPLDMRMDSTAATTAEQILNTASEAELRTILRRGGEDRFPDRVARAIVTIRKAAPLQRSGQLVDLVREAIPAAAQRTGGNPAKRTFQALRIAVNDELGILARALPDALSCLAVGGRMVVESYQSLEDKLVKDIFSAGARSTAPPDLPFVPDEHQPYLSLLTRGAEVADETERSSNRRATPVRLRAVERRRPTPANRPEYRANTTGGAR